MLTVLLVFHLIVVITLVGIILIQRSEGGALGALGGSSGGLGLISSRSAGNFLTKTTAILATLFMLNCIALTIMNKNANKTETKSAVDVAAEVVVPMKSEAVSTPVETENKEVVEEEAKAMPPLPKAE